MAGSLLKRMKERKKERYYESVIAINILYLYQLTSKFDQKFIPMRWNKICFSIGTGERI